MSVRKSQKAKKPEKILGQKKRRISRSGETDERTLDPQTVAVGGFYRPEWSAGAAVPPIFLATTFTAGSAEEAERAFAHLDGGSENVYGRHNNPGRQILEDRLACAWDRAEACAAFSSGMAAIHTTIYELTEPGGIVLHGEPVYGCTNDLLKEQLRKDKGVTHIGFSHTDSRNMIMDKVAAQTLKHGKRVDVIFIETPSNPTLTMFDIEMCAELAAELGRVQKGRRPVLVVDSTFNGPVGQQPLRHGADLVIYSCTKYIGGHSDSMGGAVLGSKKFIQRIKARRMLAGDMLDPFSSFLFLRSLATLGMRMEEHSQNAEYIARRLKGHPKIETIFYPGLLRAGAQRNIFKKQCRLSGGMLSFKIKGGKKGAFRFLNRLRLVKLAVSLGGVESLIEHPATTSHARVSEECRLNAGITDNLVRLSVGIENRIDILDDLFQALE